LQFIRLAYSQLSLLDNCHLVCVCRQRRIGHRTVHDLPALNIRRIQCGLCLYRRTLSHEVAALSAWDEHDRRQAGRLLCSVYYLRRFGYITAADAELCRKRNKSPTSDLCSALLFHLESKLESAVAHSETRKQKGVWYILETVARGQPPPTLGPRRSRRLGVKVSSYIITRRPTAFWYWKGNNPQTENQNFLSRHIFKILHFMKRNKLVIWRKREKLGPSSMCK